MRIRQGDLSDLKAVLEVERSSFTRPYGEEVFHYFLSHYPDGLLVAEEDGRIVGYILYMVDGCEACIISLAVHPRWRRRGIGGRLLNEALARIKPLNPERIVLQVGTENQAALHLYRSRGFRPVRRLKNYYGDGGDAYLMVLGSPPD
jgi:ribosomal-protein-alanine N-acetyltransferase